MAQRLRIPAVAATRGFQSARSLDLPVRPGTVVGLFGGSFDPPHAGHLHVARTALKHLGLDRIVWLVSPGNPLKARRGHDLSARVAACRRLVGREPRMLVTGVEAALGTRYTLDTLRALRRRYPTVRFVWVMGADSLRDMVHWRDWPEILRGWPVAVVARPGAAVRSRLSPAARRFGGARLPASAAGLLGRREPPAWTYILAPWRYESSTALRSSERG